MQDWSLQACQGGSSTDGGGRDGFFQHALRRNRSIPFCHVISLELAVNFEKSNGSKDEDDQKSGRTDLSHHTEADTGKMLNKSAVFKGSEEGLRFYM